MRKNNRIIIFDLDMYSNRIGFFSNNRERIGSWFGLFLTLAYILVFLVMFIIYAIDSFKRKDIRVYESNMFSNETPSIDINSTVLNLAFGLEDPISLNRFIDPSIYYPEIIFVDQIKNNRGEFETVVQKELNYTRCKNDSFGKKYREVIGNIELNNSYCLKDFNLTLAGGYKYDRMSYILIKIIPCYNETNKYICKPKEVIERYLTRGHLSIFIKDFGLNPTNYNNPILPTIQNLYLNIDKRIYRKNILNFGITEIQTDTGLFYEHFNIKKYLKFNSEQRSFYMRSDNDAFIQEKQIYTIQIRLDDNIHIQKRSYQKISEIISLIGGYMQLLSTVFSLISILTNLDLEVKILNNLFNFNLKQNKMTIKINNIKDFNSNKSKYKNFFYTTKKSFIFRKIKQSHQNLNDITNNNSSHNSIIKKNIIGLDLESLNKNIISNSNNNGKCNNIFENGEKSSNIIINNNSKNNNNRKSLFHYQFDNINNSKINGLNERTKSFRSEGKIYFRPLRMITNKSRITKNIDTNKNEDNNNIHLNLINYYCCGNICKKKKHIELFDIGVSLYRKRMDIINVFTILLLSEKMMLKMDRQKNVTFNKEQDKMSSILKKNNI